MAALTPIHKPEPSLTDFTEIRLAHIRSDVAGLVGILSVRCSPRSRIYHAGEMRVLAAKLRTEAAYIEDSACDLETQNVE